MVLRFIDLGSREVGSGEGERDIVGWLFGGFGRLWWESSCSWSAEWFDRMDLMDWKGKL